MILPFPLLLLALALLTDGVREPDVNWAIGKELKVATQVEISAQWNESPLRELLDQVSKSKRIPLFIDRRVDPDILISQSVREMNWEQLLAKLGESHGYCFCRIENIYYFGPAETAISLPSRYQKLKNWIKKNREQAKVDWRQSVSMQWDRLAQPGQLLQSSVQRNGLTMFGESLPLDVWPRSDLPEVSLLLKTTLLNIGFEKWILISKSGEKVKGVDYPISGPVVYKISNIENPKQCLRELGQKFPELKFRVSGSSVLISGLADQMRSAVATGLGYQKVLKAKQESASRFAGEMKGMRGSVLASIANAMDLRLDYAADLKPVLSQQVEFDVDDATAEEIVRKSLEGTGLRYLIDETSLRIFK